MIKCNYGTQAKYLKLKQHVNNKLNKKLQPKNHNLADVKEFGIVPILFKSGGVFALVSASG